MSFRALKTDIETIYVIDLLSEAERACWSISEDLIKQLGGMGVPQQLMSCHSKKGVFEAFAHIEQHAQNNAFLLHFTAHGNEKGIGLKSTNEFLAWSELRVHLLSLNSKMNGNLILNMMACKGIHGESIQNLDDPEDPFFGVVGPTKNIGIEQAKRAVRQFYEDMGKGMEIPHIVIDINKAENEKLLWCSTSQLRRRSAGQSLSLD